MTRGLIVTSDGFSDVQLEYTYHRFREDAILTDVASPAGGDIEGRRGHIQPNTLSIEELDDRPTYDLVVVPGGEAPERLVAEPAVLEWLSEYARGNGILGAIDDGIRALISIDVLDGRTVTGPAELRAELEAAGAIWTDEEVTVDGTFVTARGTDALPFYVAATIGNLSIPQDPAAKAMERPHWGGDG